MSALAGTLGVFALILVLARVPLPRKHGRVPLAAAILVGVVAIGALFGLEPGRIVMTAAAGAVAPETVMLAVVVLLLLSLSGLMQVGGSVEQIVSLTRLLLRRPAVAMAALPALIGLLPMPGGALFSAPMVHSAKGEVEVGGGTMSAVNYWFRHIWEHWWPLYPGVMLALAYTGGGYGSFLATQLPLGVFMVVSGLLIYRGSHPDLRAKAAPAPRGTKRRLLWATMPIWLIVAGWVPAYFILDALSLAALSGEMQEAVRKYGSISVGLTLSFVMTVVSRGHTRADLAGVFAQRATYALVFLVISVMVFQAMLAEVDAAAKIAAELRDMRVPPELVVAILPFIAGMVTGLAVGFVGVSFPIVIAVVAGMGDVGSVLPYVALAYGFGHLGQMLSPLHACHVVSNRYFETGFGPVYHKLIPPCVVMTVLIVAYFLVLTRVL